MGNSAGPTGENGFQSSTYQWIDCKFLLRIDYPAGQPDAYCIAKHERAQYHSDL